MKNSLKNKLKFDYENLHEAPSVGLWERLENELEGKKEKPKVGFSWIKYAAIFLGLITLGSLLFFNYKQEIPQNNLVNETANQPKISIPKHEIKDDIKNENVAIIPPQNNLFTKETVKNPEIIIKNKSEQKKISNTNKSESIANIDVIKNSEIQTKKEAELPKIIENKEVVAENKTIQNKEKYVKSEDLLFGRELEKASLEQENTKSKMGNIDLKLKKPKTIEILGFTVYSEENEKK